MHSLPFPSHPHPHPSPTTTRHGVLAGCTLQSLRIPLNDALEVFNCRPIKYLHTCRLLLLTCLILKIYVKMCRRAPAVFPAAQAEVVQRFLREKQAVHHAVMARENAESLRAARAPRQMNGQLLDHSAGAGRSGEHSFP